MKRTIRPTLCHAMRLLALCCLLHLVACQARAADLATHLFSFGRGPLWEVQALAATPDGQLVVCDYRQVRKYSPDGYGLYQHLFSLPAGPYTGENTGSLACAANGEVYVGDRNWGSISRVGPQGEILSAIGIVGHPLGRWEGLAGLALASDGTIYASYQREGCIKHFSGNLELINSWSTPVTDPAWPYRPGPEALAVDGAGNIWVGWEGEEIRLLKYSPTGELLRSFAIAPIDSSSVCGFDFFLGMAFDSEDHLLVLENGDVDAGPPLVTFDTEGNQLRFQRLSPGASCFALMPDGTMVVGGNGEGLRDHNVQRSFIEWFPDDGREVVRWGEYYSASWFAPLIEPRRPAFDSEGRILVSGGAEIRMPAGWWYENDYVDRYLPDGSFDNRIGYGPNPGLECYFALTPEGGLLQSTTPIAVDAQGYRYLLYLSSAGDGHTWQVLKYDPDGVFVTGWEVGQAVTDLIIGQDGYLYLCRLIGIGDPAGDMYQTERWDFQGKRLWSFYAYGQLGAVDRGGHMYHYTDWHDGHWYVSKYTASGEGLYSLGAAGTEWFTGISGMGLSEDGKLAVVEKEAARVHIFQVTPSRFTDIPWWYWAKEQIEALAEAEIVSGYYDGTYQPAQVVTRAQIAVYLARALAGGEANVPAGPSRPSFSDVPPQYWAYRHIEYCQAHGIAEGTAGRYYPEGIVDRGQMAIFLARAMAGGEDAIPVPPEDPTFPDVTPLNRWRDFYKYVEYLAAEGVVSGYLDGRYHPERQVTRDQMAVFVQRAFALPM